MYDIKHLESEWKRYKRKQVLLPLVSLFLIVLMGVVGYIFWSNSIPTPPTENQVDLHIKKKQNLQRPEVTNNAPLSSEVPSTVSKPSKKQGWHMTFAGEEKTEEGSEAHTLAKHVDIQVSTRKSDATVKEMENRFRYTKDKDDALFLARYYYDKNQYTKALNWALETNKLDSDIEESWLLFGRSKAKLGQRMEAIRVLQAYYDRTGSKKSKKLLDNIRRGTSF